MGLYTAPTFLTSNIALTSWKLHRVEQELEGNSSQRVGKSLSRLGNRNLIDFMVCGVKETNEVEKQTSTKQELKNKKIITN